MNDDEPSSNTPSVAPTAPVRGDAATTLMMAALHRSGAFGATVRLVTRDYRGGKAENDSRVTP